MSGSFLTTVGSADQRVDILQYIILLSCWGLGGFDQRATTGKKEPQKQML